MASGGDTETTCLPDFSPSGLTNLNSQLVLLLLTLEFKTRLLEYLVLPQVACSWHERLKNQSELSACVFSSLSFSTDLSPDERNKKINKIETNGTIWKENLPRSMSRRLSTLLQPWRNQASTNSWCHDDLPGGHVIVFKRSLKNS